MEYFFEKYGYRPDKESIDRNLELIASNMDSAVTPDILKDCFGMMDLTSLKNDDTPSGILRLVSKVDAFKGVYPAYPNPASICIYPDFVPVVFSAKKSEDVHVTAVAGVFPHSQSFLEVKLLECRMAVEAGAEYMISPDVNREVIEETKKQGKISIPGALTPTEIAQAYAYGADVVKVFPAGVL